jgi:hypothetical protein
VTSTRVSSKNKRVDDADPPSLLVGRAFAKQLNRYSACVIDGLHLGYLVAKVFELPAAGCLLLAPSDLVPWLARLGFHDTVHYLAYQDLSALDKLTKWVLDDENTPRTDAIRRRALYLVWRRHLVAHRAPLLDALARAKG